MPESAINSRPPSAPTLRVCLASLAFYPLYAGPALRFQRYAPGLHQRGVRMRVFTEVVTPDLVRRDGSVAGSNGANGETPYPTFEVVDGLPVQRVALPPGWRRQPAYFRRLAQQCRQPGGAVDVIQLLNLDLLAAPWLQQLRRQGIGLVFTHTLLGELSAKGLKRQLQRVHRRLPLQLVDRVVVSSSAMRERVQELGVTTPVTVIPNGVDTERFAPPANEAEKQALRRRLGLDTGWDIVLAIGPIIPRKGTEALVEAFVSLCRRHPRAHLLLVGPRHDLARPDLASFRRRLQQSIDGGAAQARVTFTGAVSNVEDYLKAADILAFTSRREGMPNVVPEAMATGLPVLMTPFIGLPQEFGRAGVHYVLSDWEQQRLAADLECLLTSVQMRQQIGEAGRRWVQQTQDVPYSLDAYAELYRELQQR
jgi:glycosyltransferase involved in cell wall biosynthesis